MVAFEKLGIDQDRLNVMPGIARMRRSEGNGIDVFGHQRVQFEDAAMIPFVGMVDPRVAALDEFEVDPLVLR